MSTVQMSPSQPIAGHPAPAAQPEARVVVTGELDVLSVPDLDRLLRCAEADATLIVLDLSELELVDAGGAQFLLEVTRRIRRAGRRLVLTRCSPEARWFLALTGLDGQLDILAPDPARAPLGQSWVTGAAA